MKIKASLAKVNEALSKIQDVGTVELDGPNGSFRAKGVEGRFQYDEDSETLMVMIDDKPWLASESMIEAEIRKFFT